jgi:hypothetical protein
MESELSQHNEEDIFFLNTKVETVDITPKIIFIVPYRDRDQQLQFFNKHMKYILEDFLEKLKNLTPIQNFKKSFIPYAKRNFKILNQTKQLHQEKNHFSKAEIKERSILYILVNYLVYE